MPKASRFVPLVRLLEEDLGSRDHAIRLIAERRVLVDGAVATDPRSLVRRRASVFVRPARELAGSSKLAAALARFGVSVAGRVALDVGAAAGGFTKALLERDASRVYAVDVGHGQLLGSLRNDPRVVVLERTNLSDLESSRIPERIDVVTVDLSYLSIAVAVPQLDRVRIADTADLLALVKPMFELRLAKLPARGPALESALRLAVRGTERNGLWRVAETMQSPVEGHRGALEYFLHASRRKSESDDRRALASPP